MIDSFHSMLNHVSYPSQVSDAVKLAFSECRLPLIRRALGMISALSNSVQGPEFSLSIARSFTIETQVDALKLALAILPCRPSIRVGELGNFESQLWDPSSPLLDPSPDAVLVLWRLEDLYPDLVESGVTWSAAQRKDMADSAKARIRSLSDGYCQATPVPILLATIPEVGHLPMSHLYCQDNLKSLLLSINQEILALAQDNAQIRLFDFAGWSSREGGQWFDERMDLFARQPISNVSLLSFAVELARNIRPLLAPVAKVLVVDLDNTLWGGILGEDGLSGIKIGHDYPGNVYRKIQIELKKLKSNGILLALSSKNDFATVQEAFATIPSMVLQLGDFSCVKVNWQPKHENLRLIADELNLALESFVFVDDSSIEREQIKHFLPEVTVASVTDDPLSILRALRTECSFDSHRTSTEDRLRSEFYLHQESRAVPTEVTDTAAFFRSLDMEVTVSRINNATLPRAVQMLQKTNQFNVTTHRHDEATVRKWIGGSDNILLAASLKDRFGDQGIIGLLFAIGSSDRKNLHVDSFLLSCRVIGRGIEESLWSAFIEIAGKMGYERLTSEYLRTSKNHMVADLYDRLGMLSLEKEEDRDVYELKISRAMPAPDWISLKVQDHEQSNKTV